MREEQGMAEGAGLPLAPQELADELLLEAHIQLSVDFSKINLDDIVLPPGEQFWLYSDEEEEEEEVRECDSGFGNVVVVDCIPVVGPEKYDILERKIRKTLGQMGTIRQHGLVMPVDQEMQKTKGYAFIEYNTSEEAQFARDQADKYKFDRAHILAINLFDDFDKYMKVPDQYTSPEMKPYAPGENLSFWLTDNWGRDQFVVRFGSETEVFWNERLGKPEPVYHRSFWTETFVQWSPLGTYLATLHRQGAAIWGGSSTFNRIMRYPHMQVRLIDFSPSEKYLVTYSSHELNTLQDTQKVILNVFDVRTGKILREFKGSADNFTPSGVGGVSWPVFRWAGGKEDKYFARIGKNAISVYETKTMGLLDKKSVKVDNIADFSWSPMDSILACFVPEGNGGNQPARVSLVQIPSREELRQKNLFNVKNCEMYWQSNGDYLAVKVDRYMKTRQNTYTAFELFRIKERDIPIEVLELENKDDKIIAFAWEPKGHRFAIIHGDGLKPDVTFYSMKSPNNVGVRVTKLITLKGRQANALFWSPIGRFVVLAGLKGYNGQLEFYDVAELKSMANADHFMATHVDWDPTGRFVATSITSVPQIENGFNMWSFSGKLLYHLARDKLFQFLWRPRPPSLLSLEKEKEIAKNLKKYSERYEMDEAESTLALDAADKENKRKMQDEWKAWLAQWKGIQEEESLLRIEIRGGEPSDDEECEVEEVETEEVIGIRKEGVSFEAFEDYIAKLGHMSIHYK